MEHHNQVSILFVNKFGAHSGAISGVSAFELANYCSTHGLNVKYLCVNSHYQAQQSKLDSNESLVKRYKIFALPNTNNNILRSCFSFIESFFLVLRSVFIKSNYVVFLTDPPFLLFWFQLLRPFTSKKYIYWSMDLFPDAFVANNNISQRNLLFRFCNYICYHKAPACLVALGAQQAQYLNAKFNAVIPTIILPCGIHTLPPIPVSNHAPSKIVFGYGGNFGAAHDESFLLELVKQLNPTKHQLIVSIYGIKKDILLPQLQQSKAVTIVPYITNDMLQHIHVNIATLLSQWAHLSVPSKATFSVCIGIPLLLNVPAHSDTAITYANAAWNIPPSNDYTHSIAHFLAMLTTAKINLKKQQAIRIANELVLNKNKSFEAFQNFLFSN